MGLWRGDAAHPNTWVKSIFLNPYGKWKCCVLSTAALYRQNKTNARHPQLSPAAPWILQPEDRLSWVVSPCRVWPEESQTKRRHWFVWSKDWWIQGKINFIKIKMTKHICICHFIENEHIREHIKNVDAEIRQFKQMKACGTRNIFTGFSRRVPLLCFSSTQASLRCN